MNLKDYRERKGLTQPQLAKELSEIAEGLDAPLISKIEKGIVEPPESVQAYINGADDVTLTQKMQVLEYMKRFGSISSLEAFRDLGVTRLSARIFELKKMGYDIKSGSECGKNRFGKAIWWGKYSLREKVDGRKEDVHTEDRRQ